MRRWWLGGGCSIVPACLSALLAVSSVAWAQEAAPDKDAAKSAQTSDKEAPADDAAAKPEEKPASAPTEDASSAGGIRGDFVNFLHFASIGQFEYAQAHARSLLARPEVKPLSKDAVETIVRLSEERPDAIETLVILINNSTVGEEAGAIMGLIREAHRRKYMDPAQIGKNIDMLAGSPTDQATGLERLIDSGEYAVPQLVLTLADARRKDIQPYVLRALPRLGKPAVNPLVVALSVPDDVVRSYVADALGRLGYPQALPYLKRLATDNSANAAARQAAEAAIRQIVVNDPAVKDAPATQLFKDLGEAYYDEADSLRADNKHPRANIWVVDGQTIKPIDVPRQIFCMVMAMECSKASLALNKDQPEVLALWLAANFRRESRLGLDVQTTEAAAVDDATQPKDFPRGVYFARSAGPECCQLVLARALKNLDRPVALGAIAGLAGTAGPNTLQSANGLPGLAEAIRFPDQLVRIRAALVFGKVLPKQPFAGANEVVPVLASAYAISGTKSYLVVDPDAKSAQPIVADLTKAGAKVVTADRLELGLAEAAKSVGQLDGIFLASDIAGPGPVDALRVLKQDEHCGLAPVVVYVKEGGMVVADQVIEADPRVGRVLVVEGKSPAEQLAAKAEQIGPNYGYKALTAEDGVALSLEATRALQRIAANEANTVFDPRAAEAALVTALNKHPSEEVRIGATRVLALLNTATAQPAIAAAALSADQTPTLRIAAFASLAESARYLGNRLDEKLTKELIKAAMSEPNLDLRTAASQALGSTINMPAELAVEAILGGAKGK
jgi:HEAT repeat protein